MRRLAVSLAAVSVVVLLPTAAFARNPELVSTSPPTGTAVRSAPDFTATYDIDLAQPPLSTIEVLDRRGARVEGSVALSGPVSAGGGRRSITFTPSKPFSDGASPYEVRVVATASDHSGARTSRFDFAIDSAPPSVLTVTEPVDGDHVKTIFLIEGKTVREATVLLEACDGQKRSLRADYDGNWSIPLKLAEGPCTLTAIAKDDTGNATDPLLISIVVDETPPPAPVIVTPATGARITGRTVRVSGTAEPLAQVEVYAGTTPFGSTTAPADGRWSIDVSLADGLHDLAGRAIDRAGNVSAIGSHVTVRVDGSGGAPVVERPEEGAAIASTSFEIAGVADPLGRVLIREAGKLVGQATGDSLGRWSATLVMPEGTHILTVLGVLDDGSTTPSTTRTITLDATKPPAPVITSPTGNSIVPLGESPIRGTGEPRVFLVLTVDDEFWGNSGTNVNGVWGSSIGFTTPGEHRVSVMATDAAGNESAWTTITLIADERRPTVRVLATDPTILAPGNPLRGTASDDDLVTRVFVAFYDLRNVHVLTQTAVLGSVSGSVSWTVDPQRLPTGTYIASAQAVDRAGRFSAPVRLRVVRAG